MSDPQQPSPSHSQRESADMLAKASASINALQEEVQPQSGQGHHESTDTDTADKSRAEEAAAAACVSSSLPLQRRAMLSRLTAVGRGVKGVGRREYLASMRSMSVSSLRLLRAALETTLVSAVLVSLLYSAFLTISFASCVHVSCRVIIASWSALLFIWQRKLQGISGSPQHTMERSQLIQHSPEASKGPGLPV